MRGTTGTWLVVSSLPGLSNLSCIFSCLVLTDNIDTSLNIRLKFPLRRTIDQSPLGYWNNWGTNSIRQYHAVIASGALFQTFERGIGYIDSYDGHLFWRVNIIYYTARWESKRKITVVSGILVSVYIFSMDHLSAMFQTYLLFELYCIWQAYSTVTSPNEVIPKACESLHSINQGRTLTLWWLSTTYYNN